MSAVLGGLQLFLLTAAVFTVAVVLLTSVVFPWLRPRLRAMAPAPRARALSVLAASPVLGGFGLAALCFLPGLLGGLWPALDHCGTHVHDGALHLCFSHLPGGAGTALGWLLVAVFVVWLAAPAARLWLQRGRSRATLRALLQTARPTGQPSVCLIESPHAVAFVSAVSRRVAVSTGLVAALDDAGVATVVAHERAHLRRRDPRRRAWAQLMSLAHLPATRRAILAELDLACEQACDDDAAAAVGSRLDVAETLLVVERLAGASPLPVGCDAHRFGGGPQLATRVDALLAPPLAPGSRRRRRLVTTLIVAATLALVDPLHHAAEHLVTLLP